MTNAQSKMMRKEGGDIAPSGEAPYSSYSSWPSAAAREAIWGVGTEQVSGSCRVPCPHSTKFAQLAAHCTSHRMTYGQPGVHLEGLFGCHA